MVCRRSAVPRRLAVFLLASLTVLAASLATPVTAAADSRVTVDTWKLSGQSVIGSALLPASGPCLADTYVLVSATTYEGGWASYGGYSYNECTGKGTWVSGSARPKVLRFWGNSGSAHVVAHIPLRDEATGTPTGAVDLDEAWASIGPAVHEDEVDTYNAPGDYLFRWTFRGTSRPAMATGTVRADTARIWRSNYLSMQVEH